MNLFKALPSALSAVRVVAMPFVVSAILEGDREAALVICLVAGPTDFFDGYLARRFGWTSRAGAWLDAVADKVLLSGIFLAFWKAAMTPGWLVAMIFGRDLLILSMAGIGLAFTPIRDFPPSVWGKLSTNVQIVTVLVVLVGSAAAVTASIWTCAAATGFSGFHYFYSGIRRLEQLRRKAD